MLLLLLEGAEEREEIADGAYDGTNSFAVALNVVVRCCCCCLLSTSDVSITMGEGEGAGEEASSVKLPVEGKNSRALASKALDDKLGELDVVWRPPPPL